MSTTREGPWDALEPELRKKMKAALRTSMRGQRMALPIAARAARASALADQLASLPELAGARTVLSYSRIHGEIDPAPTLARHPHVRVLLPRVDDDALTFHETGPAHPLEMSSFGILEPKRDAPRVAPEDVDVVLVPALALDARGHRVGYGRGFYDRVLASMPGACAVALVYDFQLVAEVPDEPFDVPVHVVATDARVLRVRA